MVAPLEEALLLGVVLGLCDDSVFLRVLQVDAIYEIVIFVLVVEVRLINVLLLVVG